MIKNKVLKNASWIIVCRIVQALLGLVISMFTARYLGPSNYGLINYAMSLVAFVTPITLLGLDEVLVQEFVNHPDKEGEAIGSSIAMSIVSALLCIVGVGAFAFVANGSEIETLIVCILYSTILIFKAMELIQYWFQAKLMAKYSSVISVIAYVVVSSYRIFLLVTQKSLYWFAVANALDALLIAVILIVIYRRKSNQKIRVSPSMCKYLLNQGKYYILANLMVVLFSQTDRIMINMMIDSAATGYYSAAVHITNLSAFVFSAIVTSARPSIFKGKSVSEEKFEKLLSQLYSVIIYGALLQGIVMTIFATPIISLLYGREFLPAVNSLRIVVWYTAFSYIGGVRNIWMLAESKQKYILPINLCGAVANVVLNYFLIPVMGIEGAAIASCFTQLFTNVIIGFIWKPIRRNNVLILRALNPTLIFGFLKP